MEQNEAIEYEIVEHRAQNYPIDSLWGVESLVIPVGDISGTKDSYSNNYLSSAMIVATLILLTLSFRAIYTIVPMLFKALFRFSYHFKIEDKLSLANHRNILFLTSAVCLPILTTLFCQELLLDHFRFPVYLILAYTFVMIISYWIFKAATLKLFSWITGEKKSFAMVGKIGYNHLIVLFFSTIPLFSLSTIPNFIPAQTTVNSLIILALIIYTLYLIRGFQIIISARFSPFFYILYLCAAELLPLLFIIKLTVGV